MDNRPIGVFDSGLGGLTSVMALKDIMPNEKVLFYGDTARTPYGSKSPDTIREFSKQIVKYLIGKDVKMIVIACNTATSMALEMLKDEFKDIPIIGVIDPTVRRVVGDSPKSVGIIGTKATIDSNIYADTLSKYDFKIKTYSLACPAFVPLIEEGIIDNEIMDLTIKYYMDDFVRSGDFDSLILGCTHYPLISSNINRIYPDLRLYSSSAEVIRDVQTILTERDMLAEPNSYRDRYYASDLSENFLRMTDHMFKSRDKKIKLIKLG